MGNLTIVVLGSALFAVLVLGFVSAGIHAARMEKRATGQMLPHEEEAYLLCKEGTNARK